MQWVRHPPIHLDRRGLMIRPPQARTALPSATALAGQDRSVFQVRRPDTLQFSSLEGLCRMAGVPRHKLRALIAKELVDNGLDETDRIGRPGQVSINRVGGDLYQVTD